MYLACHQYTIHSLFLNLNLNSLLVTRQMTLFHQGSDGGEISPLIRLERTSEANLDTQSSVPTSVPLLFFNRKLNDSINDIVDEQSRHLSRLIFTNFCLAKLQDGKLFLHCAVCSTFSRFRF